MYAAAVAVTRRGADMPEFFPSYLGGAIALVSAFFGIDVPAMIFDSIGEVGYFARGNIATFSTR